MKSVCVVGAGPSGLAAAKYARECGLRPVVFEKADKIGGLWRTGTGIWPVMQTNLSKFSCCFSDFPFSSAAEMFPTATEVFSYLADYVEHFGLSECIRLNAAVTNIALLPEDGRWRITCHDSYEDFDFVIVCSGIFSKGRIPAEFQGEEVIHSSDFTDPRDYVGSKVLVVGNAFSGAEIARALSDVTEITYNSVGTCPYVIPRYLGANHFPVDLFFYPRPLPPVEAEKSGTAEKNIEAEKAAEMAKKHGIMKNLVGAIPNHSLLQIDESKPAYTIICDGYYNQVANEKIELKPRTLSVKEGIAKFERGTEVKVDTVICATGFRLSLPFFEQDILGAIGYDETDQLQPVLLHETVFHPQLPNLAFVGLYRGPYFAVMELQARWVCNIFAKNLPLPSVEEMERGIAKEKEIRERIPRPQFPHPEYVQIVDHLASILGIDPKEKLNSLGLQYTPVVPAHFQLDSSDPSVSESAVESVKSINTYLLGLTSAKK